MLARWLRQMVAWLFGRPRLPASLILTNDKLLKERTMCENDRVQRYFEVLTDNLRRHDVRYSRFEDRAGVQFVMSLRQATFLCTFDVEGCILKGFAVLGAHAPAERRDAVLGLLNRINWRIAMGNFEMDPDDGEVRLRVYRDERDDELTDAAVERTVRYAIMAVEHFYPAIMGVIWNDMAPEDALAMIEPEGE